MKACICFLTYNRLEYTKKSLQSIIDNTPHGDYDLLLWDNFSDEEGMVEWLKDTCVKNHFHYIFCNTNAGLTTAMNNQMKFMNKLSAYDCFCHIANDVVVPKGWLEATFKAVQSNKVGVVGLNLEEGTFETEDVDGITLERLRPECNVGGMHYCIPKRVYDILGGFKHVDCGYGQQDANHSLVVKMLPNNWWVYYLPLSTFRGEHLGLLNFQKVDDTNKDKEHYHKYHEWMGYRLKSSGNDTSGGRSYRNWVVFMRQQYDQNMISYDELVKAYRIPEEHFIHVDNNKIQDSGFWSGREYISLPTLRELEKLP